MGAGCSNAAKPQVWNEGGQLCFAPEPALPIFSARTAEIRAPSAPSAPPAPNAPFWAGWGATGAGLK